jgi:hypothetical protein
MTARLGRFVLRSLEFLQSQQLFSGEVLCVRKQRTGIFNCSCPIASTFVHNSLSFIDPGSLACEWRVLDCIPPARRRAFAATVAGLRWRLRAYIACEQDSDGTWRFHGRQSSLGPDLATTACAAAVLGGGRSECEFTSITWRASNRLSDDNLYSSAQALRFLILAGAEAPELEQRICSAAEDTTELSVFTLQAIARTWSERLRSGRITSMLISKLLNVQTSGRLEAALRISALLDLGFGSPMLDDALRNTLDDEHSPAEWPYEPFSERDVGSPGVTMALILANTIRIAARSSRLWR